MRYRFLLRPGWIAALTALCVLLVAFVELGLWQWGRAHRTHRLTPEELAQRTTPVALGSLLKDGGITEVDALGRAVVISGTFDGAHQLLVPDRELNGTNGYIVIAPLKTADGTVVVSRGWTAQPQIPAGPQGAVTLNGWLAAPEPIDGASREASDDAAKDPAHRIASVDIATLVNTWPYTDIDQAYVNEQGPDAGLTPVPAPPPPNGKTTWNVLNVGYTVQWWLFGVVAVWWVWSYVRRIANPEAEDDDEDDLDDEAEDENSDVVTDENATGPEKPEAPADQDQTGAPEETAEPIRR
jgi:cytochrome oxidase assembly protein ShyY1